ncbi:MAG: hypothetical protein LBE91_19860 [Tannerella sp.]|jgi:hypothetical protein|nr:hypothetical protein [Tannerella sp.]
MKTIKYYLLFLLTGLTGVIFNSCVDYRETTYENVSGRERMTMFAWSETGFLDGSEANIEAGRVSGRLRPNKMSLVWFGINDCAGYHVRVRLAMMGGTLSGPDSFTKENNFADYIIDDPNQLSLLIENLQYGMEYRFAIRTLSKEGVFPTEANLWTDEYEKDPHHSEWYGYGDGSDRPHAYFVTMYPREGLPEIIGYDNRAETSATITFVTDWETIKTEQPMFAPGNPNYQPLNPFLQLETGPDGRERFKLDYIMLEPTTTGATASGETPAPVRINLTEEDRQRGSVDVNGLIPNVQYMVNGVNATLVDQGLQFDAFYNTEMMRMRGGIPPVITIKHELYTPQPILDPSGNLTAAQIARREQNERTLAELSKIYDACRLDTILNNFMDNTELAEGTEFVLEAGKAYFLNGGVNLTKGMKLRGEDPNNRPTVYMGLGFNAISEPGLDAEILIDDSNISKVNDIRANNFGFGRAPRQGEQGSVVIEDVVLENIKFEALNWYNYDNRAKYNKTTGAANYFINQNSQVMAFKCESFELRNCDFQGMGRGFIRFQGTNRKLVDQFIIDNCLIYNCGGYDVNGRGYSLIAGDNDPTGRTNFFRNFKLTNTTIVNSSFHAVIGEENGSFANAPFSWDVTVENCTFLDQGVTSNDRLIVSLHYPPNNSKFTVKRNLIIVCPAEGELATNYYQSGMRIRSYPANISFDIADNYSTNVYPGTATGIFTSYPFNHQTTGAGIQGGALNVGGAEALEIREGFPSLAPWELMINPRPFGIKGSALGHKHDVPEGLYYQDTPQVRNHEIVRRGIGDPRWSSRLSQ